jgi:hypothetical protein
MARDVVFLAAVLVFASLALDADAADHSKSAKRHAKARHFRQARPALDHKQKHPNASGWYPNDRLPFGSARWWEQKQLEGGSNGAM